MSIQGYQKTVLPNGFEVHTHRLEGVRKAYLEVRVKAGSYDEPEGQTGVAHYLEHMHGYGSLKFPEVEFLPPFIDEGGDFNMTTSNNWTNYWRLALPHKIPRFLEVVSDVLANSVFDQNHVDKEREPILVEQEEASANLDSRLALSLDGLLYPRHKLSVPVIGFRPDISRMNYEMLNAFKTRYYRASNMFLVATGDVDHQQYVDMAEEYFGGMPLLDKLPELKPIYPVSGSFHNPENHGVTQLKLGFPVSARGSKTELTDIYASHIVARKIFDELRLKRKLLYTPKSGINHSPYASFFEVTSNVSPQNLRASLEAVLDVLEDVYLNISEEDIQVLKNQEEESILDDVIDPKKVGEILAAGIQERGEYISFESYADALNKMTVDDVKQFIRRLIVVDPFLAVSGPADDVPEIIPLIKGLRNKMGLQTSATDASLGKHFRAN